MPGPLDLLAPLASAAGQIFVDYARDIRAKRKDIPARESVPASPLLRADAMPTAPSLPALPELPRLEDVIGPLPTLPGYTPPPAPAPAQEPKASEPVSAGDSYSAEIEDTAVACVPCTRGHLSAMAIAAAQAESSTGEERRAQVARVAAEALVLQQYDWRPAKLARSRPEDRAAIEEIRPEVEATVESIPMAPRHLVLAWAATDESLRFARSRKPTDQDRREIETRMRDAEAWLNYAEREELAPHRVPPEKRTEAREALALLREARHQLVTEGYELPTLEAVAVKLQRAVVLLTPDIDDTTASGLRRRTRATLDRFHSRILQTMRMRRQMEAQQRTQAALRRQHPHRPTPERARQILTDIAPTEAQVEELTQPEQISVLWNRLERFLERVGVRVRVRNLEYGVEGEYNPETNVILLSASTFSKDSWNFQTLVHEATHAILHNPRCNPRPSPDHQREEAEADYTTVAVLVQLNVPVELYDGTELDPRTVAISWDRLAEEAGPDIANRVHWAADIIVDACQEAEGVEERAKACPVWQG